MLESLFKICMHSYTFKRWRKHERNSHIQHKHSSDMDKPILDLLYFWRCNWCGEQNCTKSHQQYRVLVSFNIHKCLERIKVITYINPIFYINNKHLIQSNIWFQINQNLKNGFVKIVCLSITYLIFFLILIMTVILIL